MNQLNLLSFVQTTQESDRVDVSINIPLSLHMPTEANMLLTSEILKQLQF
jgi:hypothetical protein